MKRTIQTKIATIVSCIVVNLGLWSCVTSTEDGVTIHPAPEEDSEYFPVYEQSTRKADVTKDFGTRYKVSVTYLSHEFRAAMSKRLERLYQQGQPALEEATQKAGFFVSVFTSKRDVADLSNRDLWNILMRTKDASFKPVAIRKLSDKERWSPFFPQINLWSTDYLVVFDAPSVNPMSADLVDKTPIHLVFANADAQVELSW